MNEKMKKLERSSCESIDVIFFNPHPSSCLHRYDTNETPETNSKVPSRCPDQESGAPPISETESAHDKGHCSVSLSESEYCDSHSFTVDRGYSDCGAFIEEESLSNIEEETSLGLNSRNYRVGSTLGGILITLEKSKKKHRYQRSKNLDTDKKINYHPDSNFKDSVIAQIYDFNEGRTVLINDTSVIDYIGDFDHIQDLHALSAHLRDQLHNFKIRTEEIVRTLCRCELFPEPDDHRAKRIFGKMDRGRTQASMAYEKELAERTASRISKPETSAKKQVAFKSEVKKTVLVKRASTKTAECRHDDAERDNGKKTRTAEDDVKTTDNERVFHTRASGLVCSAPIPTSKKIAVSKGDAATSTTAGGIARKRLELRQMSAFESDVGAHTSPFKKSQLEVKELKNEVTKLTQEIEDKNTELANLKASLQIFEERERQIKELEDRLHDAERQIEAERCRVKELQEELRCMDERYTALKVEFAEKEDKFEVYLMNMYKKGLDAARFEREEELEMLAKTNKSNVTVKELTRKLSRTESELAKWQGLRLEESYFHSELPSSESDATLSFVRDSFLHFISDSSDIHEHLKALLKIFKYSDEQLGKVWRGLESFKNIDRKKIMDRIEIPNGNALGRNGQT